MNSRTSLSTLAFVLSCTYAFAGWAHTAQACKENATQWNGQNITVDVIYFDPVPQNVVMKDISVGQAATWNSDSLSFGGFIPVLFTKEGARKAFEEYGEADNFTGTVQPKALTGILRSLQRPTKPRITYLDCTEKQPDLNQLTNEIYPLMERLAQQEAEALNTDVSDSAGNTTTVIESTVYVDRPYYYYDWWWPSAGLWIDLNPIHISLIRPPYHRPPWPWRPPHPPKPPYPAFKPFPAINVSINRPRPARPIFGPHGPRPPAIRHTPRPAIAPIKLNRPTTPPLNKPIASVKWKTTPKQPAYKPPKGSGNVSNFPTLYPPNRPKFGQPVWHSQNKKPPQPSVSASSKPAQIRPAIPINKQAPIKPAITVKKPTGTSSAIGESTRPIRSHPSRPNVQSSIKTQGVQISSRQPTYSPRSTAIKSVASPNRTIRSTQPSGFQIKKNTGSSSLKPANKLNSKVSVKPQSFRTKNRQPSHYNRPTAIRSSAGSNKSTNSAVRSSSFQSKRNTGLGTSRTSYKRSSVTTRGNFSSQSRSTIQNTYRSSSTTQMRPSTPVRSMRPASNTRTFNTRSMSTVRRR